VNRFGKHMSSLLFPSPSTARVAEEMSFLAWIRFGTASLPPNYSSMRHDWKNHRSGFCFDDDYDIRFEGERLIVYPRGKIRKDTNGV